MAKVNIVDQVQAMENEDKVKKLISKQVRLPATIIGGKKSDGKETIQYINPENAAERRVTTFRVAYSANMGFPFIFEIGNGWGQPFITKKGGTMVKEGTVRIVDKVQIFIQEQHLFPLLRRVQLFIETMTAQAMQKYYEKVSEPMLQAYDTQD